MQHKLAGYWREILALALGALLLPACERAGGGGGAPAKGAEG